MGVLNVTPDSFSDGGRFASPADAVRQGEHMVADGAAILDVGGESTRPGAAAVELEREKSYEVTALPVSDTHPFLEKAGIEYRGVRSDNFVIRGNWDEEALMEAAMFAERSYAVCKVAFEGFPGFRTQPPDSVFSYAIFDDRDIFKRVLLGNADLFEKEHLDFLLEEVGAQPDSWPEACRAASETIR